MAMVHITLISNKKAQVPTILIFLVALLLSGLSLFAFITFKSNFKSQSETLSEMMREVEFNKQYIIAQTKIMGDEAFLDCINCSAEKFKEKLIEISDRTENQFRYEGTGNFYGKIRNKDKDFIVTEANNIYTISINSLIIESKREKNKIKRTFDLEIEFKSP
jgi:hypothetical protein